MNNVTPWKKSSRSGNEGNCVETRRSGDRREIRDSKDLAGPVLSFGAAAVAALIADLKDGELARPEA